MCPYQQQLDDRQTMKATGGKGDTETKTENSNQQGLPILKTLSPIAASQLPDAVRSSLLGMGDSIQHMD